MNVTSIAECASGGLAGRLAREGRVVEWRGETVVRFPGGCIASADESACGGCPGAARARQIPLAWLDVHCTPAPNERLTLEVTASGLSRVAAVLFALPLAALMAGAWLGAVAGGTGIDRDIASGAAGLAALAAAWMGVTRSGPALARVLELTVRRTPTSTRGA